VLRSIRPSMDIKRTEATNSPGANLDALARPKGQRQDVAGQP